MKKVRLLTISSFMLIILLFSMVGCIKNDGQSSKEKMIRYSEFYRVSNKDIVSFGKTEDVTIDFCYCSNVTREEPLEDYSAVAELYIGSLSGGMENVYEQITHEQFSEMELFFVVDDFYADKYPPFQVDHKEHMVWAEITKTLVIPKELFKYETGRLAFVFSAFGRLQGAIVVYEKTEEEICLFGTLSYKSL